MRKRAGEYEETGGGVISLFSGRLGPLLAACVSVSRANPRGLGGSSLVDADSDSRFDPPDMSKRAGMGQS